MSSNRRHDEILKILARLRSVSVGELTNRLKVSEVTIRKDLTTLEEMGFLVRGRGNAELAEDSRFRRTMNVRRGERIGAKRSIARKAKELLREGDTIFIDAGSTCMLFAEELGELSLRVVTNSIDVMTRLADKSGISLISVGGAYHKEAGSFLGPMAIQNLHDFQIGTCFLGATGFSSKGVFSSQNTLEAQVKQRALEVSERRVILADSSKYELSAFSVFARPDSVDVLVSDQSFSGTDELVALGIEVLRAEQES
jgi:DeoR/GlpR family transcriptional regulator of sugar metabolism